jgi:hypothetical protein
MSRLIEHTPSRPSLPGHGRILPVLAQIRHRQGAVQASAVPRQTRTRGRINTIVQTCFFAISSVLPRDQTIARIEHASEGANGYNDPGAGRC